ncbi:MAG: hypothetical protein E6J28_13255 [Chloroflexi bacterium]|nr:MAG: hypothetical protein E6J28_13255 [Chloroflexota bacterium]
MIDRPARRRRAKQLMDGVTVACVAVAIAIGTGQLVKEGVQEFIYRPPGVGSSASKADTSTGAAEAQPPQIAAIIPTPGPPVPSPSPSPIERSRGHHAGHHG